MNIIYRSGFVGLSFPEKIITTRKESHKMNTHTLIPKAPWQNPQEITPGTYHAVIKKVSRGTYNDHDTYIQLLLWLPDVNHHIATNLYMPKACLQKSMQRAYRLSQCVGLEANDLFHAPTAFEGKHLRVQLYGVDPERSGASVRYSDVRLFLPPEMEEPSEKNDTDDELPF